MATLEELEGDIWAAPENTTRLIETCHRLRKEEIEEFSIENFRILLGQGIGIDHLAPLALIILEREPLVSGDFYPGDLLSALVRDQNWAKLEPWAPRIVVICREVLAALALDPDDIEINGKLYPSPARELAAHLRAYINRRPSSH